MSYLNSLNRDEMLLATLLEKNVKKSKQTTWFFCDVCISTYVVI